MSNEKNSLKTVKKLYLELRDKFLKYDNVIGVGFGSKEYKGKLTDELAVIVFVNKKIPRDQIPKDQLLPKEYQKIPIDVREPRIKEKDHLEFLKINNIPLEKGECNLDHFFLSDYKIHKLNQKRKLKTTEPGDAPQDPSTAIFGDIFVIEDDGTLINDSDGSIDHVGAYDLFRTQFGDHYDFVFFHYDTGSGVPSQGNSSPTIHNMITGINQYKGDSYNDRSTWSSSKIQSYQKITNLTQVRRMLHETAHRWCSYAYHKEGGVRSENLHTDFSVPSQAIFHWGDWFDNDNSCMDYDYFDWLNSTSIAGEFEKDSLTSGLPAVDEFRYHPLDLYLMGLVSGSEVTGKDTPPGIFRYIQNPTDADGDGSFSGTQMNLNITNVTDEEGIRSPAYPDTQRVFHQAFILITKDLSGIGTLSDSSTVLGNMEQYRAGFLDRFRESTLSRGMIDGSLLRNNYDQIYIRDNTADTGLASSTGAFWNSPDIWIRNSDDGGSNHQNTIRGQDNFIHARINNSSGTDYENVIVRIYRANWTGTEFYFPDDWHPDQLIGESTINVPAGSDATAKVRWDSSLIPDETWHPCLLVEIIPMEISPENNHHVWENRKLAQKNINIIDPPGDKEVIPLKFAFGHPLRIKEKPSILTIAKPKNLSGLELFLDPDGIELKPEFDKGKLPDKTYFPSGMDFESSSVQTFSKGLTISFPNDADIILGGKNDSDKDTGCTKITICRGSTFKIEDVSKSEQSSGKLVPIYRNGRLLYRIPNDPLVGLIVPLTKRGLVFMTLHIDLSHVPKSEKGGLVQIIQSESDGKVVGGLDIEIKPK